MRPRGKREKAGTGPEKTALLRPVLTLSVTVAVTFLLLGFIHTLTADRIARTQEEKFLRSMRAVLPAADIFTPVAYSGDMADALYGAYSGTELLGYVAEVSPRGFGGKLHMTVGVNLDGKVTGVNIFSHSETSGTGSRALSPEFLSRFIGTSGTLSLGSGVNSVDGISGATVTAGAVTDGVNAALSATASLGSK